MSKPLPILQNTPVESFFTRFPRNLSIEITSRCNLRCRHCFNESGPYSVHELPLERIEGLLDEVKSWDVKFVRLSGGEPTVHSQFRDVVDACRAREITIGLNTNGVYKDEMLAYLTSAPIEVFFISLDGMEANNDAIRGTGTFRRAVQACRQLKEAGQRVIISFHVGEGNRGDVPALVALAAEIAGEIKIAPIRPVGRAVRELPHALIQPRNIYEVVREVTRFRRKIPDVRVYTDFDLLEGAGASGCERGPDRASCKAGRSLMNVRADGTANACAFFDTQGDEFSAGNIYQETATEIWQRPESFHAFRVQQKSAACQTCGFYQQVCSAGCPAISYAVQGKLDSLDPTCFADLIEPDPLPDRCEPVPPLAFAELVMPPEGGLNHD